MRVLVSRPGVLTYVSCLVSTLSEGSFVMRLGEGLANRMRRKILEAIEAPNKSGTQN